MPAVCQYHFRKVTPNYTKLGLPTWNQISQGRNWIDCYFYCK